jgi:rRNA maturation RNase YbeY
MILFHIQTKIKIPNKSLYKKWIKNLALQLDKRVGELNFIFCSDESLLELNQQYLQHDTLTDVITFDYSEEDFIQGDIFISTERVQDNAKDFDVDFNTELRRVIAHGVLHLCGYKDKTKVDSKIMREKENWALSEYSKTI